MLATVATLRGITELELPDLADVVGVSQAEIASLVGGPGSFTRQALPSALLKLVKPVGFGRPLGKSAVPYTGVSVGNSLKNGANVKEVTMATVPEPQIADPEAARLADRLNVLLEKMGHPGGKGTEWWLHVTHEELDGLTAMQAWQRGRRKQVLALVETHVSREFAQSLSARPSVVWRLLKRRAS